MAKIKKKIQHRKHLKRKLSSPKKISKRPELRQDIIFDSEVGKTDALFVSVPEQTIGNSASKPEKDVKNIPWWIKLFSRKH